jgi:hypothetical protein
MNGSEDGSSLSIGRLIKLAIYGVVAIGAITYGFYSRLNPPPPGEAVSMPAYGFAADLPAGWRPTDIPEPNIGPPRSRAVLVLTASRPGKGDCDLTLWPGPRAPLDEVMPVLLEGVVQRRMLAHRPTVETVNLSSGLARWAKVYPPSGYADVYALAGDDDRFYVLWCQGHNRHTDDWRLVAESFEFMPAEE